MTTHTAPSLEAQLQQSKRLLELNRQISATLDLKSLLQAIVDAAAKLTGSEQASISQYDHGEQCLRFIAARWMDDEIMESMRVPVEGSIAGQAFRDKEPQIVADAQGSGQLYRPVDEASGFTTRSLLSVPMLIHGQASGVLSAVNKEEGQFSEQDVYVMETLASQAAIAIHNAELLKASQDAFDQLSELDNMKSNFISITSHELRIPLGLVLGHASYLKEIAEGETFKQAEVIERAALRLKDIVEDLSRVETMQSGQSTLRLGSVDLGALLEELAAEQADLLANKEITLECSTPDEALSVQAEASKLASIFDHLIRNAVTFTDTGGRIEISFRDAGDWAAVSIADTGIGIPPADLQRIFERFYQVEAHMTRRHGGMGLGLSVCKMLAEMHGGRIEVESVEGKGSQFTVWLPKQQGSEGED